MLAKMLALSPFLSGATLAVAPLMSLLIARLGERVSRLSRSSQDQVAGLSAHLNEVRFDPDTARKRKGNEKQKNDVNARRGHAPLSRAVLTFGASFLLQPWFCFAGEGGLAWPPPSCPLPQSLPVDLENLPAYVPIWVISTMELSRFHAGNDLTLKQPDLHGFVVVPN